MVKHYISEISKLIMCLGFGVAVGYLVSRIVLPLAYAERGYEAFGGEWVVIIAAGWLATGLIYKFFKEDKS